ncbi:MAG: helix-turn-helix domain-containing protein [Actinomycetota bacterium]|nr:helix-turn-helix domain-containing protein [Actinomycetota bacterium]
MKFTRIPRMVTFRRAGVAAHLIPTYCALSDYAANQTGLCWPRMDTLARTLNLSVRTVQRHVAALVAAGLVELVERRRSARGRFSSWTYRLLLVAGFSKARTTGHGRRPVKGGPMFSGTKQSKNTSPAPPQTKEEQRRRRWEGYEWLLGQGGGAKEAQ